MKNTNNKSGYILTVTLALIVLCMFMAMYVFNRGFIFVRFSQTMVDREKARQLAYGTVQLAVSQLVTEKKAPAGQETKGPQAGKQQEKEVSDAAQLLKVVLPNLNKAQKFTLKQPVEGINGAITIALGAEEGKININRLYDFEKHAFIGQGQPTGDMKKVFQELFALIKDKINADLFEDFEKFLKERKYPLNDVTELLTIKSFEIFKNAIFYDPAADQKKETIYLTDIFTVSSMKKEIEPWLLSESLKILLKITPNKESLENILKNFKEQVDWKKDWNTILKPYYGIDFNVLPKGIVTLFSSTFAPKIFWAASRATVAKVTISVWALLEREKGSAKDAAPTVVIRALYLM